MTTKHATCTHPKTKAGRASCRKGSTPAEAPAIDQAMLDEMRAYRDKPTVRKAARTDVHRPEAFDPEAYEYSHSNTYHSDEMYQDVKREGARMLRLRLDEGWVWAPHQVSGRCGHCGAALLHHAVMLHEPTQQMIVVGETCLEGRFEMATAAFQEWRKMRAGNAARNAKAEKLAEFVRLNPVAEAIMAYTGDNDFIQDLARKLRDYAELSDKQLDAAANAMTRDRERKAAQADREARMAAAPDVTAGRQTIVATFVSRKWVDSDFGYGRGNYKMLIEDANGNRYYGTEPGAFRGDKGDAITITATVQPSKDDSHFGFFKRPVLVDAAKA